MRQYSGRSSDPEEVRKRAMNDPEVQQIMSDPAMRMILEQMQSDPQAVQVMSSSGPGPDLVLVNCLSQTLRELTRCRPSLCLKTLTQTWFNV